MKSPSGAASLRIRPPSFLKFKGRLSSEAEAGNCDAYSDVVSRRLCYKGCGVSGKPKTI